MFDGVNCGEVKLERIKGWFAGKKAVAEGFGSQRIHLGVFFAAINVM